LKALVDEFSRFARMPRPRLELGDLNEVIRQTAQLYDDRLNGIELRLALEPTLPSALLDVEQMKRVFVNLIDNAVEALTDAGDGRGIVITTSQDVDRELLLAPWKIPVKEFPRPISSACFSHTFRRVEEGPAWAWRSSRA
jgi:nitrogen fixation/metabolism regulation signal transduction histidine kinase